MRLTTTLAGSPARRALVGAAAVLLALGATACTPRAGSAVVVGDTRVTVDEVQADSREVEALLREIGAGTVDTTELNRRQVGRVVTSLLLREAAERRDVTVTRAEVDALVRESLGGTSREEFARRLAVNEAVPVSDFDAFAEVVLINQRLLETVAPGEPASTAQAVLARELAAVAEEIGVVVNPRYGEWDPATLSVALPADDLSAPDLSRLQTSSGTVSED